jgi:hypothetical protein
MKKLVMEINDTDKLKELFFKFPNWYELGSEVRKVLGNTEFTKLYTNDYELGKKVSSFFIKKT